MSETIDVLDIDINNVTAKEAIKGIISFMNQDSISIVDFISTESLIALEEQAEIKEEMKNFDLILPSDKGILLAAKVADQKILEATQKKVLVKAILKVLHRNKCKMFLLVDSLEHGTWFSEMVSRDYCGIDLVETAKVVKDNRADDMLVNAINGEEIDVVVSLLESPLQEDFIIKNKNVLNIKLFLGLGNEISEVEQNNSIGTRMGRFLKQTILKKEIQKRRSLM
ncbi:MAG TPA: WecB/TagA/CpsF family glycosyltransferase [Candidatus Dorea intestinavium]|nr:WecB/TagA/CpsF family glycosyltransferase [Candidatus Dorea intestinavium]